MTVQRSTRLYFLDNLKIFLTILVIMHHAGQAYGPPGGDWPIFNATRAAILGPFFSVNASFFMGLFFLIAGYFVPGSVERKGSKVFLRNRFISLGIPILLSLPIFLLATGTLQIGHLWFLEQLLLYSSFYVVWRYFVKREVGFRSLPTFIQISLFALVLSLVTFLVRIFYPINQWLNVTGLFRVEMAHLPQYISLFAIGVLSYKNNLLERLPVRMGRNALILGLVMSVLVYVYALHKSFFPFLISGGGFSLQSLVWSIYETILCLSLSLGLITLFREKVSGQTSVSKTLAQLAFTTYVIHIWIIVGLQMALAPVAFPPLMKFVIVCLIGIPASFFVSFVLRKIITIGWHILKPVISRR